MEAGRYRFPAVSDLNLHVPDDLSGSRFKNPALSATRLVDGDFASLPHRADPVPHLLQNLSLLWAITQAGTRAASLTSSANPQQALCIHASGSFSPRQILHPLVFSEVNHHPRNFADLVDAGAGVHHQNRPVEDEGAEKRQRDRDAPHADGQRVHVEERIAAGGEDAVDDEIGTPKTIQCKTRVQAQKVA